MSSRNLSQRSLKLRKKCLETLFSLIQLKDHKFPKIQNKLPDSNSIILLLLESTATPRIISSFIFMYMIWFCLLSNGLYGRLGPLFWHFAISGGRIWDGTSIYPKANPIWFDSVLFHKRYLWTDITTPPIQYAYASFYWKRIDCY